MYRTSLPSHIYRGTVLQFLRTVYNMASLRPIVMSGPSGSGKSTLLTRLFKEFPNVFAFSVSHTTRQPRKGEENGKHYHFVAMENFKKLIDDEGFLEHAQFSGNCYGTSKMAVEDIQNSGKLCVLDVEINGVKSIKKTNLNARFIFIKPPSIEALKERLTGRGTESDESLQKRLASAKEALEFAEEKGSYDHIIVNDQVDVAYEKLKGILMEDISTVQKEKIKGWKLKDLYTTIGNFLCIFIFYIFIYYPARICNDNLRVHQRYFCPSVSHHNSLPHGDMSHQSIPYFAPIHFRNVGILLVKFSSGFLLRLYSKMPS